MSGQGRGQVEVMIMEVKSRTVQILRNTLNFLLRSLAFIDAGIYYSVTCFMLPPPYVESSDDEDVAGSLKPRNSTGSGSPVAGTSGTSEISGKQENADAGIGTPSSVKNEMTATPTAVATPTTPTSQKRVKLLLDLQVDGENVQVVSAKKVPMHYENPSLISKAAITALQSLLPITEWFRKIVKKNLDRPIFHEGEEHFEKNGKSSSSSLNVDETRDRVKKSPRKRIAQPSNPSAVTNVINRGLQFLRLRGTPAPSPNPVLELPAEEVLKQLEAKKLKLSEKRKHSEGDSGAEDGSGSSSDGTVGDSDGPIDPLTTTSSNSEGEDYFRGCSSRVPTAQTDPRHKTKKQPPQLKTSLSLPLTDDEKTFKNSDLLRAFLEVDPDYKDHEDPDYVPDPDELAASSSSEPSSASAEADSDTENLNVSDLNAESIPEDDSQKSEPHDGASTSRNGNGDIDMSSVEYGEEVLTKSMSSARAQTTSASATTATTTTDTKSTKTNAPQTSSSGNKAVGKVNPNPKTEIGRLDKPSDSGQQCEDGSNCNGVTPADQSPNQSSSSGSASWFSDSTRTDSSAGSEYHCALDDSPSDV